jgi:hypothetical protein
VPQIMHGRAPEVFLHQLSWNIAIWPILCRWCDVKPNQTNKHTFLDVCLSCTNYSWMKKTMYYEYFSACQISRIRLWSQHAVLPLFFNF